MIYAVVKCYEQNGVVSDPHWYFRPTEHDKIYGKIMEITGNNHEIASNAADWCELATEGETFQFREGEVEIKLVE